MDFFENIKLEKKINLITENFYKNLDSYPSRNELSNFLIETFDFSDIDNIENNSLLEVSQIFVDKVISTKQNIFKNLQSLYPEKEIEIKYLDSLIKEDKISSILNINYDTLFYNDEKIKKLSPFDKDTFAIGKTKLYKPLGELDSIDTCIITSQDLKKLKVLPFYKNYFNSIRYDLKLRTNIICAFDLKDSDFFEILEFIFGDFPNLLKDVYLVTNESITNSKVLDFIKKYNIQILNYESSVFFRKLYNCFNDIEDADDEISEIETPQEIIENSISIIEEEDSNEEVTNTTENLNTISEEISENMENPVALAENSNLDINPIFEDTNKSELISGKKEEIIKTEIENKILESEIITEEVIDIDSPMEDSNREVQFSLFDNIQEEKFNKEEEYIPQDVILENNKFSLETGLEKKYSSLSLNKFPLISTNLPENIVFDDIGIVGNAEMKIGEFSNNCFIRILSNKINNISLLEIKSRDLKLRFSIINNTPETIKVTSDYFYYEIFSTTTLGRAIVVLEMLESLFSEVPMEFAFKNLAGKITLNNISEVVKIKTIHSLFSAAKEENLKVQMDKLENIDNIFYLLNLELLLKDEHFSTWCDYEVDKTYLHSQDKITFKRLHHLDKKSLIEETIVLKSPVSEKDISENKIIGKRKVCTVYLKKLRGEF
ncbi:SIR2 family protein [Fusobacterium sp. FSA-380-WT-3A]|uniref:SIR2 family protein n=1 Tax=Fusobacterium sp. FSA-380-WT-3A TaxID=2725304 RepID=UPI001476FA38|nr:SIR2 family protein [Fusobacterium sp. FSA-380-WT-3A]NME36117.1 hypothetical protein [Fusobacterium sp. FSA-380-WT-3A]